VYCYTRDRECTYDGPCLTSAQFRRLDSTNRPALACWDLWGSDDDGPTPLVVVPTEDIRPTAHQRKLLSDNAGLDKAREFGARTPWVSHVLSTGLFASDYIVGGRGPLSYVAAPWGDVWRLLQDFSSQNPAVEHPKGFIRDVTRYRSPQSEIHGDLIRQLLKEGSDEEM
jgi:hypothetical protein